MMIEIGQNLKYEKFKLETLTGTTLKIKDAYRKDHQIDVFHIKEIEIVGVKSNSGFCGSMEWGMGNPTFILPTNFFYNIFNSFKRKNDVIHMKVALKDGKEFIAIGTYHYYNKLQKLLKKQNKIA